jgi:UDP-N-acetylmuramate dehydrogenase
MLARLAAIPGLVFRENALLQNYTRFGLGGAARVLADAPNEDVLWAALEVLRDDRRQDRLSHEVALIGGGSNLVASDHGFPGVVLRYTNKTLVIDGPKVSVGAGVVLQDLVDATIAAGLEGLHTMTGIPGWVGGAIYGNAGAYGHSIHEFVESVRYVDASGVHEIGNAACAFRYRESVFKQAKDRIILEARLRLNPADPGQLKAVADGILKIRNGKYPPEMRCAGSIFKNLILAELPESVRAQVPERVVREGKVPSAYFLEVAGAKGMTRGGIQVADYHANLIYNSGGGTSVDVRAVVDLLKARVAERFGLTLEEEVQYLGPC